MNENDEVPGTDTLYPAVIVVPPATENRNRVTTFFRFFLALPHIILVGAPVAYVAGIDWTTDSGLEWETGGSGGLVSVVVFFVACISWLSIVLTARHPDWAWRLGAWYLRWRVRAVAYMTLLRDEYPPFGDGDYPADFRIQPPAGPRNRLTVFFRILLALPHLLVLSLLGVAWSFTTAVAWLMILLTGRYPEPLYGFALGVLAWTTRVEAYLLLLRDEYPPFTLRV